MMKRDNDYFQLKIRMYTFDYIRLCTSFEPSPASIKDSFSQNRKYINPKTAFRIAFTF